MRPCLATLFCLLFCASAGAQNARIVQWVEDAPQSDPDRIALGYPVPVPVDTPLPFDGFRSHAGLHARHQDLAANTPWVEATEIGLTRHGATIWAYRIGDADSLTRGGLPEPAMLTNGGIHAREWQSPEVVTGIMELLAGPHGDQHLYRYLLDNVSVILVPVLNVDGFRQTQRYPDRNWLGTDPNSPQTAPRDGRMRRKNMLAADTELLSQDDHLAGVDLNRNNAPYWNTSPGNSSSDSRSLVHHGAAAQSEPETRALQAAAQLGPVGQLALYTDVHSFSQVHLWVRNDNDRLARQTELLLGTLSGFHAGFPANKEYGFDPAQSVPRNRGIGTTDEYFTHTFEVPSWTLEVEPRVGGVDYGGLGRNGHDGFILPEAQIRRVREELAQTFAVAYYRQAGPPAIAAVHLVDQATGAAVFTAGWDRVSPQTRTLHREQAQPILLGRRYQAWIAFDKPMRWRQHGLVAPLPGQLPNQLDVEFELAVSGTALAASIEGQHWPDTPQDSPAGYFRYQHDAYAFDIVLSDDTGNRSLVGAGEGATLRIAGFDMTGLQTDADPATVARWEAGGWSGYENTEGADQTDSGGADRRIELQVSAQPLADPFVIEAGTSSAWYDPERDGEGFVIEVLPEDRAVMYWFTYDEAGGQDWYLAVGEVRGNRAIFPELLRVSGGRFGQGFDPASVTETVVGSASFTWSGCNEGTMQWLLDRDGAHRQGRMNLRRLSRLLGIDCGNASLPAQRDEAFLSGSWFDPAHAGEGYALEVLVDDRALVYWFSFDTNGKRRWFFGTGAMAQGKLEFPDMLTTRGGIFGAGFDPAAVEVLPWGNLTLELDCHGGAASFDSSEAGFPAGSLALERLTALDGLECSGP